MRCIGFSTGALALDDYERAFAILNETDADAIEVSALRYSELDTVIRDFPAIQLRTERFNHISFHAPSSIPAGSELEVVEKLQIVAKANWPIVVHPNIISTPDLWRQFGALLCIENMDKRKPIGQTASDLVLLFQNFPEATFCFDLGHARQVDPTMSEAYRILKWVGDRLIQLHVSEVNSQSKHDPLNFEAILAFRKISHLIPQQMPIILESRIPPSAAQAEIDSARITLSIESSLAYAGD